MGLQKEAVAREVRQLGYLGHGPQRTFWISDLLRSFLAQSGSNHDRLTSGSVSNETAEQLYSTSVDAVKD